MKGNRMSSLPVAQFCGRASELSQIGSGRAAAQSTAFHAVCAGAADAEVKLARLTDDERAELRDWHRPADVVLGDITLRYADAEKELEVAITSAGRYCLPSDPDCLSVGHLDFAWLVTINGQRWAFVADIKRSEYTVSDGPESLQLHGYAMAYADKVGADVYVTGIWGAVEGTWWWAAEPVVLGSKRSVELADAVLHAAANKSTDYALGAHCSGCYGRLHCPAYVLPPEVAGTSLAPFSSGDIELSGEQAAQLLATIKRFRDTADKVEAEIKERVRRRLLEVENDNGKVYRPVECAGRLSLSKARLAAAGIDPEAFMERGKPFERWGWVKP